MTLFEINQEILNCIDAETGEFDIEKFEQLQLQKDEKIENIALWTKELTAEALAIREEEKALAERRKSRENKAEQLKKYLDFVLQGQKFSTSKVECTYRKSTAVVVEDEFIAWASEWAKDLLKYAEPTADKTAIKEALKSGIKVEYAELKENNNLQIK